jgi:sulfite reductase (ferredoxin)
VRLTPAQDLLLCGLAETDKKDLEEMLRQYGIPHPDALSFVQKQSMACPALPTCGLALSESERVFPKLIDEIESILKELGLSE